MADTTVWASVKLPGFHHWPDAPPSRSYLRDKHRHLFHVRVDVAVKHDDRDTEFHDLQQDITTWWGSGLTDWGAYSCERIAESLGTSLKGDGYRVLSVDVSEDGESGATVRFEEQS